MRLRLLLFILLVCMLTACGGQSDDSAPEVSETAEVEVTAEVTEEMSEGERLFTEFNEDVGFACSTCHLTASDSRSIGPGLLSIEDRFETYNVDAESLEAYILESILDPIAFIVPDEAPYPNNLMPRNYGEIFTEEELDQLVDFILSL